MDCNNQETSVLFSVNKYTNRAPVFDQEGLTQNFRRIMIETYMTHNRTLLVVNNLPYKGWMERPTVWQNLHTYESWARWFRDEVEKAILRKAESLISQQDNQLYPTQSLLDQVTDSEFALRAQLTFTLFRITVDCIGMPNLIEVMPHLIKNGFWTGEEVLNGYVLRTFNRELPYEIEFGRYIKGKGDGRFLEYTAKSHWMIHEYKLSRDYQPPVESRKARVSEIWFDSSLNEKVDELLADRLGPKFFEYHIDWRGSWAPPYV